MTAEPDIGRVAAAIGDRTRAAMLAALLDGEALSAGELARRAGVAPSTATGHITRLLDEGLILRRTSGRRRYHVLAGEDVAAALEALARIAPPAVKGNQSQHALRFARTCYDHLAGALGVAVSSALVERGIISHGMTELSTAGDEWLRGLGIEWDALRTTRRVLVRPCLDWSERRNHVAGAVGAAIAGIAIARRWVIRVEGTRGLRLTLRGREGFYRALGLELSRELPITVSANGRYDLAHHHAGRP
jgi:DNA-binding transcriptional ArsR family regulator